MGVRIESILPMLFTSIPAANPIRTRVNAARKTEISNVGIGRRLATLHDLRARDDAVTPANNISKF